MTKYEAYNASRAVSLLYRNALTVELFFAQTKFFLLNNYCIPVEELEFEEIEMEGFSKYYNVFFANKKVMSLTFKTGDYLKFDSLANYPLFFENKDDVRHYFNNILEDRIRVTGLALKQYQASLEKENELRQIVAQIN